MMSNEVLCEAQTAVLQHARRCFRERPDWLTFVSDVRAFCGRLVGPEDASQIFRQVEFQEVERMIVQLAMHGKGPRAQRIITVRLPSELYESLKREAARRNTSLNRLCTAKLLRAMHAEGDRFSPEILPAAAAAGRPPIRANEKNSGPPTENLEAGKLQ